MKSIAKITLLIIFILSSTAALASALGLSGGILVAQVSPGDHIRHELAVSLGKNESPLNVTIDILDMLQGPRGETLARNLTTQSQYSAKRFLKASPTRFYIKPGETQRVLLEGDVPSQAAPGGKYAIINIKGFPNQTGSPKSPGGVSFGIAINGLVELIVSKDKATKTGLITGLSVQKPVSGKQQNISVMFNNTGDVHYNFVTSGAVMDANKRELANDSVPSGIPIMPGAMRLINFSITPKKELIPGMYDINATVQLDDGTVLAGKDVQFDVKN